MSNVPDDLKEQVKEILLEHRGKDNSITAREINDQIDVDNVGSFPGTRMIIRELCIEDGIPIAGYNKGYFVIESETELQDYLDNLESRMLGMSERRYEVKRAAGEWDDEIETDEDLDLL